MIVDGKDVMVEHDNINPNEVRDENKKRRQLAETQVQQEIWRLEGAINNSAFSSKEQRKISNVIDNLKKSLK